MSTVTMANKNQQTKVQVYNGLLYLDQAKNLACSEQNAFEVHALQGE